MEIIERESGGMGGVRRGEEHTAEAAVTHAGMR
jgi:hypothetical protein